MIPVYSLLLFLRYYFLFGKCIFDFNFLPSIFGNLGYFTPVS